MAVFIFHYWSLFNKQSLSVLQLFFFFLLLLFSVLRLDFVNIWRRLELLLDLSVCVRNSRERNTVLNYRTVREKEKEGRFSPILWITAVSIASSSSSLMKNTHTSISNTWLSCELTLLLTWPLTSACPDPGCWWCHSSAGWLTAGVTSADVPDVCRRSSSPALRITHTLTINYSTQISSYTANCDVLLRLKQNSH